MISTQPPTHAFDATSASADVQGAYLVTAASRSAWTASADNAKPAAAGPAAATAPTGAASPSDA